MDFRLERKWSVVGFCTGAIAGLVAITPAAGFIGAPVSHTRAHINETSLTFSGLGFGRCRCSRSVQFEYSTQEYHAC